MNKNIKIGQFGEQIATDYLIRNNYKIIERNIKTRYQELDIIATINNLYIFVEVKTRTSFTFGSADEAMSYKKMQSLREAMLRYIYQNKINQDFVRLDLIAIDIDRKSKKAKLKHYEELI